LLTSTFAPTLTLLVEAGASGVKPGADTTWYFGHHVGLVYGLLLVAALAFVTPKASAKTAAKPTME
jgi:hypothetical protein